jgi:transposase-like protein
VRLSTERVLQETLAHEQAEAVGRGRYEARGEKLGDRNGYENGTLKTGEGVWRVKLPQIRGREDPYQSPFWGQVATTSDVLTRLMVEMDVGGRSQRDIEYSLESAVGHFLLSQSTVSELTDTLNQESEAWRTRDLSHEAVASLFIETVYEPLRRWGQKTGVLWVGAIGEDGRKVLLRLATTNSESDERC